LEINPKDNPEKHLAMNRRNTENAWLVPLQTVWGKRFSGFSFLSIMRNLSMRAQIGLSVGFVILALLFIQSFLLFNTAENEVKRGQSEQVMTISSMVAREVDRGIERRIQLLESLSSKIPLQSLTEADAATGYLKDWVEEGSMFEAYFVFSSSGQKRVSWPKKFILPTGDRSKNSDFQIQEMVDRVLASKKSLISEPIGLPGDLQPRILIATPIRSVDEAKSGVLVGSVNLTKSGIIDFLHSTHIGESGYFYLVDGKGVALMHPDQSKVMTNLVDIGDIGFKQTPLSVAISNQVDGVTFYDRQIHGIDRLHSNPQGLLGFKKLDHTGWFVAAVLPRGELLGALNTIQIRVQALTIAFIVFAVSVALMVVQFITSPLERLTRHLNDASRNPGRRFADFDELRNSIEADRLITAFIAFKEQNALALASSDQANKAAQVAVEQLKVTSHAFNTMEGMLITDENNVILKANQALINLVGYSEDDLLGRNQTEMLDPRRYGRFLFAEMSQSLQDQLIWQGEVWVKCRSRSSDARPSVLPEPENLNPLTDSFDLESDEGSVAIWMKVTAINDALGRVINYVYTLVDLSVHRKEEESVARLAFYDTSTGLPNRSLFIDRLQRAAMFSARNDRVGCVLFIDIDSFKTINDLYGYEWGNEVLKKVGARLSQCVRHGDTVSRIGGDKFAIILEDLPFDSLEAMAMVQQTGEKILSRFEVPLTPFDEFDEANTAYSIATPSIGAAIFYGMQLPAEDILKQSEIAMYQAKKDSRNKLKFFDQHMETSVSLRAATERDLRDAIEKKQFVLFYQIQVDQIGSAIGVEALLRWRHPKRGIVPPAEYIELAEETGLILPIGLWVLQEACRQLALWNHDDRTRDLTMAVNISAVQCHQDDFVEQVIHEVQMSGADPSKLKLELTESMVLSNMDEMIGKIVALKKFGIRFSLDDFGTGYSSLAYLQKLPVDQIKIDQAFVRDMLEDEQSVTIAKIIVDLARNFGMTVIAEGVETVAQRDCLELQGCNEYQGYLYSRPIPIDEFERLLQSPQHTKPIEVEVA
jgi:diguanylate cyclase (GGDEF)-like protein